MILFFLAAKRREMLWWRLALFLFARPSSGQRHARLSPQLPTAQQEATDMYNKRHALISCSGMENAFLQPIFTK